MYTIGSSSSLSELFLPLEEASSCPCPVFPDGKNRDAHVQARTAGRTGTGRRQTDRWRLGGAAWVRGSPCAARREDHPPLPWPVGGLRNCRPVSPHARYCLVLEGAGAGAHRPPGRVWRASAHPRRPHWRVGGWRQDRRHRRQCQPVLRPLAFPTLFNEPLCGSWVCGA